MSAVAAFSNSRGGVSIRRTVVPRSAANRGSASPMRAPVGVPARAVASARQGRYAGNPIFGTSGRNTTAQGTHKVTNAQVPRLGAQTLYPTPSTLHLKSSTARPSYTVPYGAAPTDTHAGTQTGVTRLRPYGGPPPTPLNLGSYLMIGRATVKRQVLAPPQPNLIPHAFRKLISRRG